MAGEAGGSCGEEMAPRGAKKTVAFGEKLTHVNEYDADEAIDTTTTTTTKSGGPKVEVETNRFKHFLDPIRFPTMPSTAPCHTTLVSRSNPARHTHLLSAPPRLLGCPPPPALCTNARRCALWQGPCCQLERGHCQRARAVPERA